MINFLPARLFPYNPCKQFGPSSGVTKCQLWSGSKLFDTVIVFLIEFSEKVDFENNQQTTKKSKKITQHAKS